MSVLNVMIYEGIRVEVWARKGDRTFSVGYTAPLTHKNEMASEVLLGFLIFCLAKPITVTQEPQLTIPQETALDHYISSLL